MKCKQWWVFIKDGKYYAVEQKHGSIKPKGIGIEIVGDCSFEKPVEAIDYITFIREGK